MRRYRRALIGLAAFALTAVAMTWMVFATLQREIAGSTNTYSAVFTDVSGMAAGDDVRIAGVRVGRVDKIELVENTLAKATFRVQRGQALYTNTIASVTYQNVIGQRYLGLSASATGQETEHAETKRLPNRGQIPKERTTPSFDISYMLNGFEPLFTELDPQQVDNITASIIQAFQGDSASVLVLTTQASALAETLAGPDQVLGDVIANMNALMTSLTDQNTNLETMIRQMRGMMSELADRREELLDSVGSINAVTGRLATIVDNITPDVKELIGRQPGFLGHGIHDGRARFAYMAANLPLLIKGFARISQEGSYLNVYACDLDLSLWRGLFYWFRGILAAFTPNTNNTDLWHSQVCR